MPTNGLNKPFFDFSSVEKGAKWRSKRREVAVKMARSGSQNGARKKTEVPLKKAQSYVEKGVRK